MNRENSAVADIKNTDLLDGSVFICDNLPFLKSLDTESVDLVCIDPPFAKNATFTGNLRPPLSEEERRIEMEMMAQWGVYDAKSAYDASIEYPDQDGQTANFKDIFRFQFDVHEEWIQELEITNPGLAILIHSIRYTHGDSIAAYIGFMSERMIEIRRILKPAGSVYIHCDHTANAYLRQMMDAIFRPRNFRNEIAWMRHTSRQRGSQHRPKRFGHVLDTILFYGKSDDAKINPIAEMSDEERESRFPLVDDNGERYYDDSSHIWSSPNMGARPNLCYEWQGFTNPHPSGWRLSRARMDEEFEKGNFVILPNGRLQRRKYERDWIGSTRDTLWDDIGPAMGNERTGYPTQKPWALAKRIIEASSNPGDMVLDCFAGCAYVPVAAQLTGRRWIACDMSPRAWTAVRRQFHKHPQLGIRTEGEMEADENGKEMEPRLETHNRIIRVRGPYDLPVRTTPEADLKVPVKKLPQIKYKQRPCESDQELWQAFVNHWGTACWYCGTEKANDRRELQLDHIEPNARDGTNDDCWNRALACVACNSDKGDRLTAEETIDIAFKSGRISTAALRAEMLAGFNTRTAWTRERWETVKTTKLVTRRTVQRMM